ncbi:DNA topoisomerase I, mitochondrial isoform X2 [Hydra vulgaris]|uniref:DNA topoisomerase I n=1 Tax=Hydra vulgaris TaxID=6087 RepID=A0ABM4DJY6_HYDVU
MNGNDTQIKKEDGTMADINNGKIIPKEINILAGITPQAIKKLPKIPKMKKEEVPLAKLQTNKNIKQELLSPKKEENHSSLSNGHSLENVKKEESDSDDDKPLKAKVKVEGRKRKSENNDFEDVKKNKNSTQSKNQNKEKPKKVKKEEEEEVWRWWDEDPHQDGIKWKTLSHEGPYFPPEYEPMPKNVKFYYDGKPMQLSLEAEEVATFYAKMLDHDYVKKDIFNENFFEDWRKEMTAEERNIIKSLDKCDFKEMHAYFMKCAEEKRNMTKEEKQAIKEANLKIAEKYGFCEMDGHKQKVGNFRIEPPGLFRGRGDHPKQGKLKKRVSAKEVIINIGKEAKVPQPPEGQKWKAVQHDNTVSWLACWVENIAGGYKYVMLNAATRLKGEKDWQKYETARKLKECVETIRENYINDWKSKEMKIRQRGVAMYFIDKLALRAGHEKEEGESADTVGCCSLRVEHITLHPEKDGQENVVEFDFLGKDSIRYTNSVPVEKRVFKNLQLFMQGKQAGDDLFDRLSTTSLNKFLGELMPGLSAKVFRTYNASITLQQQLNELTEEGASVTAKFLQYNRANRAVAILCNHQRAAPKTFDKQMENIVNKLKEKKKQMKVVKKEIKELKREYHEKGKSEKLKTNIEKKKNQLQRLEEQYFKLEVNMTDKEENKEIALGTSKLNYLDPRISIAWCKKHDVPIEKIYNKTQRLKFQWAIDMTEADFEF